MNGSLVSLERHQTPIHGTVHGLARRRCPAFVNESHWYRVNNRSSYIGAADRLQVPHRPPAPHPVTDAQGMMSGELDELAAAAAGVLVSELAGDSWADAKQWFTAVVGHEGRLAATRADLAGTGVGPARDSLVQAQVRAWTVRLRDVFEDNPAAARTLRDLVTGMRAQGLLKPLTDNSPPAALATAPQPAHPAIVPQLAATALNAPTQVSREAVPQDARPDSATASDPAVVPAQFHREPPPPAPAAPSPAAQPPAAAPPTPAAVPMTIPPTGPEGRGPSGSAAMPTARRLSIGGSVRPGPSRSLPAPSGGASGSRRR
jgi:hypothetical protein